jgi:hypothetical protein
MASAPPFYLQDSNGKVWLIIAQADGTLGRVPASPPLSAPTQVLLNDMQSGQVLALTFATNGDIVKTPAPLTSTTTLNQIPVSSNSGGLFFIQIVNGRLQTVASSYPCNTPISFLSLDVLSRLEENYPLGGPIFWDLTTEIYSGLVEAMNDLMLLVGRPTQSVMQPLTLTPNSVWQTLPKGLFLISDLYGPNTIRQVSLASMDYVQSSWDSGWTQDTGEYPLRWGAIGFNLFFVHPAPLTPVQVTATAIALPTTSGWPYDGSQLVPFRKEFQVALEMYATHYCTLKEGSKEAQDGIVLYGEYLQLAQRLSVIEDIRDPALFSKNFGAIKPVERATKR